MKKMYVEMKILVPDDFEAGDCDKCPYQDLNYARYDVCRLGFSAPVCPLEVCENTTLTTEE